MKNKELQVIGKYEIESRMKERYKNEEYHDVEEFNSEDFYAFAEDLEPKANILGNPIQRFNDEEEIDEFNLYLNPQLSQISTVIEDIIKDENKSQKLLNEFLYNKQNKKTENEGEVEKSTKKDIYFKPAENKSIGFTFFKAQALKGLKQKNEDLASLSPAKYDDKARNDNVRSQFKEKEKTLDEVIGKY